MKIEKGWILVAAELAVALLEVLKKQPDKDGRKEGTK